MKICFYSPYLGKHFGGGEKYILDCARVLSETNQVKIAVNSKKKLSEIKKSYEKFLGVDLDKIEFVYSPIGSKANFLSKLFWTKKFDCLYYLTDGSIFFSLAKKNILHIQFPFKTKKTFFEKLKLLNWKIKNTNSNFTKKIIEENWGVKINYVHWPMVSKNNNKTKKEKIILNVGRFFTHLHSKRQDVLLDIFSKLIREYSKAAESWKLVLIGSVEDQKYANKIKKQAKYLPVKIIHNLNRENLLDWYQKAEIYWHATGYDVDEFKNPEKVEHFGISTVEAMSAGAIPIVLGKGGQNEILGQDLKDLAWQNQDECVEKTLEFIKSKEKRMKIRAKVIERSKKFNEERFTKILNKMIE